jgi:hypothetical protein
MLACGGFGAMVHSRHQFLGFARGRAIPTWLGCHWRAWGWCTEGSGFAADACTLLGLRQGVVGELGVECGKGTVVRLREFWVLMHRWPCVTHRHVGSTS